MFLIYDKQISRHIGITEQDFDVSIINANYELKLESVEGLQDFENYKKEIAVPEIVEEQPYEISKYTLLNRLEKLGIINQFISFIKSDAIIYEKWSAATILMSDNPMVVQISNTLKTQLNLSDETINYVLSAGE